MRAFFRSFGLLTACVRQTPQRPVAKQPSACQMVSSSTPLHSADSTNAAVHDFARFSDAAYSFLYIERTSGHPERDYDVCVVQQANGRWRLVQYRGAHTWTRTLPRLAFADGLPLFPGHYTPSFSGFSSLSITGWLWVKQGHNTTYSMALDLLNWDELTASEQHPLQPGFDLVQRLRRYQ